VPKGAEHVTRAARECHALIVEPRGVVNTGEADRLPLRMMCGSKVPANPEFKSGRAKEPRAAQRERWTAAPVRPDAVRGGRWTRSPALVIRFGYG
jgi:hypothetical protein